MSQSKLQSLKETLNQSFLGIVIGLITMRIMLPLIEDLDKNSQTVIIVFVMFILSTVRGYLIRRFYNV